MAKSTKYKIRLLQIKVENLSFTEPDEDFISTFDAKKLMLQMGASFLSKEDTNTLVVKHTLSYHYNEKEIKLLDYASQYFFEIDNLPSFVEQREGEKVDLPNELVEVISDIVISTSRGVIFAKTAGSYVNQFYVPLINTSGLTKAKSKSRKKK